MRSKTTHSLIVCLILTVGYLPTVTAVTTTVDTVVTTGFLTTVNIMVTTDSAVIINSDMK